MFHNDLDARHRARRHLQNIALGLGTRSCTRADQDIICSQDSRLKISPDDNEQLVALSFAMIAGACRA
jgi:hypothetical protein